MVSAAAAFAGGVYYWRFQPSGMRLFVVLLALGLCIDSVALYHIAAAANMSKYWFAGNHAVQFSFVVIALLSLGRDVLQERMYWLLRGSLYVYSAIILGLVVFMPSVLVMPYFALMSYLWLLFLVSETALHYHRTETLSLQLPETYVMFAFMLYTSGIVLMQSAKLIVPQMIPSYLHIAHGAFALMKNTVLFLAFRLNRYGK